MAHEDKILNDCIGLRRGAYPSIEDQLDLLWHGMNANPELRIEPFYSTIKEIKDRFPKPE